MTNVCLLISDFFTCFWLFLHVGNIKLFCTSKIQNKDNSVFLLLQILSNLGKFSEINKQFDVKSWLPYQSYSSVWWILSCTLWIRSLTVCQTVLSEWVFYVKNHPNLSEFFFQLGNMFWSTFFVKITYWLLQFSKLFIF